MNEDLRKPLTVRQVLLLILTYILCIGVGLFCEITAHAEETDFYYEVQQSCVDGNIYAWRAKFNVPCIFYLNEKDHLMVMYTDNGTRYGGSEYGFFDLSTGNNRIGYGVKDIAKYQTEGVYFTNPNSGMPLYTSENVFIFDTYDSAVAYIDSGDDSGQLNKPGVDYSIYHDFSKDTYSNKIPVPQVSNIHMNGFTLTNKGDYWYDVIVKSKLRGVDIETSPTTASSITGSQFLYDRKFVVSNHQIHGSHYWNFTVAHVGTNQTNFNMKDIYGQDNESALLEDFKEWSTRYPTYRDLPTFKFTDTSISMSNLYQKYYVYDDINGLSKLKSNGMTETTFYIRYYDNTDMTYGQWVSYTYKPGHSETIATTLTTGTLEVAPDGTVIEKDYITGTTDENGNISYGNSFITDTSTDSALVNLTTGMDEFMSLMNIFKSFVGELPEFVNYLFSFFPWWLNGMLIAALVLVIVLRILGR